MYYTYLLKSERDGGYYIGYSSDLKKRFIHHTEGKVDSTRYRRPLKLLYYEAYETEELARKREQNLKQFGSAYTALLKRLQLK